LKKNEAPSSFYPLSINEVEVWDVMKLQTTLNGHTFKFKTIIEVMTKANEPKSADRYQKMQAESETERIAAKIVLSHLTVADLTENPTVPYEHDEVTRVNIDGLSLPIYKKFADMEIGELREWILSHKTKELDLKQASRGFIGEVAAAVAKICSAFDLIYGASKIQNVTRCHTEIGQKGTLSVRAQTNSTTDDVKSIVAGIMEAVSYGCGDACFGINPVEDSVEGTTRIAEGLYEFMMKHDIPTQISVLSHITTQMDAMKRGAPLSLLFNSIGGTQACNEDFGVTKALIEEAYQVAGQYSTGTGPNFLYFETGQGSEVSIGADCGVDEMTLEARTYGFARYFKPFMVNNVTGFIGPETIFDGKEMIRGNLEDHFMGKLLGLPMGIAPCYTAHANIDQDDQEMATMLLAMAGANYYMGVPLGDDVMLSYQDTSFHNDATMRELMGKKPAPDFFRWCVRKGILDENGALTDLAGDGSIFMEGRG
jgi:ethanolamine ammonia-lyase large subunit